MIDPHSNVKGGAGCFPRTWPGSLPTSRDSPRAHVWLPLATYGCLRLWRSVGASASVQNFACTVSEAQNLQKLTNADGSRQAARNSASLIKTKGRRERRVCPDKQIARCVVQGGGRWSGEGTGRGKMEGWRMVKEGTQWETRVGRGIDESKEEVGWGRVFVRGNAKIFKGRLGSRQDGSS